MQRKGNLDVELYVQMWFAADHARPYLQTLHGESKDYTYINAVEVDGFTRKAEFIVTEWPKHSTVEHMGWIFYLHESGWTTPLEQSSLF